MDPFDTPIFHDILADLADLHRRYPEHESLLHVLFPPDCPWCGRSIDTVVTSDLAPVEVLGQILALAGRIYTAASDAESMYREMMTKMTKVCDAHATTETLMGRAIVRRAIRDVVLKAGHRGE